MTKEEFGESLKFYGDWASEPMYRSALNLQYVASRSGGITLHIEICPIPGRGQSPSWADKVTLQLTSAELVSVCSTLLGYRRTAKGAYHGESRNKGFQISSNPAKGALFSLTEKGRNLRHLLDQSQRAEAAAFVVRRLAEAWKLDSVATIAVLERVETLPNTQNTE